MGIRIYHSIGLLLSICFPFSWAKGISKSIWAFSNLYTLPSIVAFLGPIVISHSQMLQYLLTGWPTAKTGTWHNATKKLMLQPSFVPRLLQLH